MTLAFDRDSYRLVRQTFLFEGLGRIAVEELARQIRASQSARVRGLACRGGRRRRHARASYPSRPPAAGDLARGTSRTPLSRWLDRTFPPSAAAVRSTFLPEVERRSSSVRST